MCRVGGLMDLAASYLSRNTGTLIADDFTAAVCTPPARPKYRIAKARSGRDA
jgi:hypothetical protein